MKPSDALKNHRILIIDDNPAIHDDIRKILSDQSELSADLSSAKALLFNDEVRPSDQSRFEIDSAYQGEEGLRMVQQAVAAGRPYAMAFVDVRMPPGWDGVETISRIWKISPDLQVVVCTAYSDYSWEEIVRPIGKTDRMLILKKPFDNIEVLQLAHALTEKWLLTQQARRRLDELDHVVRQRTQQLQLQGAALESAANSIIITDPAGIILWTNEAFTRLTGYTSPEIIGKKTNIFKSGKHDTEFYQRLWQTITSGQVWRGDIIDKRKNGSLYTGEMTITPVLGESGAITHYIAIKQDITERKQLEQELHQSQKMEAIGQLAAGVAHDFNNLLTVIQGNAELALLIDAGQLSAEARERIEQVVAAANRGANLTRQLLVFGRKQVIQARPLNLNDVVANLTKMLNRIIGENIRLQCTYATPLPSIHADPGMLEQAIINLAINARDAMPRGGQLHITTQKISFNEAYVQTHAEARTGDFVGLTISDTGTGIAPENLARIFEPFFTTKDVDKGTGLGLATVYGVVKQHQGWIEVASQVGAGATFKIFLPALDVPARSASAKPFEIKPRGGTETILLVEDDDSVRLLDRRLLESFGYRVREATSGRNALELWQGQTPDIDLVLTDVIMPDGVSGVELAEQLWARRRSLKIIFMSGYSGDALGHNADFLKRNQSRFLQKPCPPRTLLDAVRRCLDEQSPPDVEGAGAG